MKIARIPSCASFGTIALVVFALGFALVAASCNFFGDPDQFRPKAKETVVAPISAAPAGGIVANETRVTLSTTTEGAAIYFTTDETEPSPANGTLYSAGSQPVITPDNFILRAIAVKDGLENSDPIEITYTIDGYPVRPTATPTPAELDSYNTYITLETVTPNTTIRFTLGAANDNSLFDSEAAFRYYGPDEVEPNMPLITEGNTVLKAVAINNSNGNESGVLTLIYTLPTATPKVTVLSGTEPTPTGTVPYGAELELSCTTEGATIYYTLDGSAPHFGSDIYNAANKPILVAGKTRLRTIAQKDGMAVSAPLEVDYTLTATEIDHIAPMLEAAKGTLDNPTYLPVAIDLGTTADYYGNPSGNWQQLLAVLNASGDYVKLDLSLCMVNQGADGKTTFGHDNYYNYTIVDGMDQIINIALPHDITSIYTRAFSGCNSLALISLPDGITSIGDYAFNGCNSLALDSLPNSITSIGYGAFANCTSIAFTSLPEGLISIDNNAFYGCTGLTQISLPSSLTSIGGLAFSNCTSLSWVSLPSNLTSIDPGVFSWCTSLSQIYIPSGVTTIGNSAFSGCSSLTEVYIPPSVTSIKLGAFVECTSLERITLPAGVEIEIDTFGGGNPFYGCTSLTFTLTGNGALSTAYNGKALIWNNTDLISYPSASGFVNIPEGITYIGPHAFSGCTGLTEISMPSSLTSIGEVAFSNCTSLTEISLPEGLTSIGYYVFSRCTSLTRISLPSSITTIGYNAFDRCTGLTGISLLEGLTSIANDAFSGCTGLTNISLPSSLTSIGRSTFSGCTGLAFITCLADDPPEIDMDPNYPGSELFQGTSPNLEIRVPSGSVNAYKTAVGWNNYVDKISAIME